ncbi:3-deoxy-D-manno-octulosonic acid transferase [Pedobacter sp. MW01-1-1]|uniref:3-deoxy-D-manno-octulosonic acid transferase n=1 Tax=Pedobacter sp. MW01-1-1 TaxID=3383027 RepID=UPI003FEE020A
MRGFYSLGIKLYSTIIYIFSFFNKKAKLFREGRKNIFEHIASKIDARETHVWFHFASLGEFEQGRPVLEKLKMFHPEKKIVVTFFSPSGYEIRKNYALADVFYLPLDSKKNAKRFIELVNPEMAIFTKYEFWHFYFQELAKKQIPLFLISGIFRENQVFFKWYGNFYRGILNCVQHFFVQNEESVRLLNSIGITHVSLSGDTRFDRVFENAQSPKKLPQIENFIGSSPVFVGGSTWPEDEKLIASLIQHYPDWKFILAPHEIHEGHIESIVKLFANQGGSVRYSKMNASDVDFNSNVLIIDNIGMLSSLYQYGKVAYIGGGFGVGIHNTLEAAAFGLPVLFGPNYAKFQEAKDLIAKGAAKSITNASELEAGFALFKDSVEAAESAKNYVESKKGATDAILKMIG